MTPIEWRLLLLSETRTAKVATVRSDGRPHVAPVWFDLDGNDMVFMTGRDTIKDKNILRDTRIMLSIDDERPPFSLYGSRAQRLPANSHWRNSCLGATIPEAFGKSKAA